MNDRLQAAFDALDAAIGGQTDDRTMLIRAKVRGLMRGYDARWRSANLRVIGVEETITAPLTNPTTGRSSRTFTVAGKLDVRAMDGDVQLVIDHKTTSEGIEDPSAPYWRQLVVEGQVSHYMLLEWLNGRKIDAAMWDVVRKPGISPREIPRKELPVIIATGEYCGFPISEDALKRLREGYSRETFELYELRLASDCSFERPAWYFQRRMVPRLDNELHEYAVELWDHGQEILAARATGRNPRNSGACMLYGRPCKYLGVCSGHDDIESGNWAKKDFVHVELPVIGNGDGREVLTNSRIRNFQTCRRKHLYDYEIGIQRIDDEEAESLIFGSLYHAAQEAWWKHQIEEGVQHGNSNSAPAIAVGVANNAHVFAEHRQQRQRAS